MCPVHTQVAAGEQMCELASAEQALRGVLQQGGDASDASQVHVAWACHVAIGRMEACLQGVVHITHALYTLTTACMPERLGGPSPLRAVVPTRDHRCIVAPCAPPAAEPAALWPTATRCAPPPLPCMHACMLQALERVLEAKDALHAAMHTLDIRTVDK